VFVSGIFDCSRKVAKIRAVSLFQDISDAEEEQEIKEPSRGAVAVLDGAASHVFREGAGPIDSKFVLAFAAHIGECIRKAG
jgi:hypothetical protein